MPTLGQPDASIYSDIQLPKPLNIGGPMQQSARQAGPNAAMERLAGEQQKDQQIQSLAQQYGDDYDGLVKAVTTLDPERGLKMQQTLSEARKTEAQNRLAQTESSLKSMTWVEDGVKLAIQDPTQYPKLLQSLAKQPGGSQFLQYAPDPNDPDLKAKLQNLLPVFVDTKDFQKVSQQSYRDYLNGDLELSAVRKLAAADTPDKRQLVDSELKGAGLSDYSKQYPDAASASQAFTALVAQKQQEKPGTEGSDLKQYATKWARDHGKTYDQMTTADMDAMNVEREKTMRKPVIAGAAGAGPLTGGEGGGLELAGTMMRLTGRVPVGMSRSGLAAQVTNEAARQNKMVGQTPVAMMQKSAVYQGDQKALASLQKQAGAADAYETKALAQLDIVDGLSDQVWRTKSPLINRAILAGQTEIAGDKDATLLLNAIQTASNEYAKIMMGGTASAQALSDSASKEAHKLLNAGMSKGTLKGATALMRQEMGLTMNGYDAAQKHILENMGGAAGAPQSAQPTPQPSGQTQKIGRFTVTVK